MVARIMMRAQAGDELLEMLERDRKAAFIDGLGWDLREEDGRERDQFDTPESLILLAGDPPLFSMRLLPERSCMVRELWPEVAGELVPGSWEQSRWVRHGEARSLREMRAAIADMMRTYREQAMFDMFSIATDRVARSHKVLGMAPQRETRVGDDIVLCQWDLR